jgi:tripartite ATP-independent transporter DctP family solute receptor
MYKRSIIYLLVVILLSAVTFMGYAQQDSYTIKLTHVVATNHASHITTENVFKKCVEERSNGRLKVQIFPDGQLGGDREAIEAVQMGNIEMTFPAAAPLSGFVPEVSLFDLPFLFNSYEQVYEVLDGDLGKKISDIVLEKSGIRVLGWFQNGFRNISNNIRPIEKPEDLKGIDIRTMETPAHMATFRALGANPTPLAYTELYTALQQGVVDAQENPPALTYYPKFYEVQKYYSLTGHVYAPAPLLINENFFQSLPEDLQSIIIECAEEFKHEQRAATTQQDIEMLKMLEEEGMEINEITPEQIDSFREAVKPVYEEFKGRIGEELVNEILEAVM